MIDAGYIIYDHIDEGVSYPFDKTLGSGIDSVSQGNEDNRLELKTFGRFPYVYYAGKTDYATFELSTVFTYNEQTGVSARQQVDEFSRLVKTRRSLTVDNSQGQSFKCDVKIIGENSPSLYVEKELDYIELRVRCTQIDI